MPNPERYTVSATIDCLHHWTTLATSVCKANAILLPTHDDEHLAFGDTDAVATLARYRGLGVPEVVVKDGKQPTVFECDGEVSIRPVSPAIAVDTTGAGDSFNGAYLAARLGGATMADAIAQAQGVSAAVVGQRGALLAPDALRAAAKG